MKVILPEQVITQNGHRYIPVPLKCEDARALIEAAAETASNHHGNGTTIHEGDGWTRHLLFVESRGEGSRRGNCMPPGKWIIQYDYSNEDGTSAHQVYLAGELI